MPPEPDTRTAILDAGERLFAERGFAATTIKHIGTEAGVNSALLYYYFADKERLYREVLRRLLDTLMSEGEKVFAAATSPEDAIRGVVRVQGDLMASKPHIPRLIARELVDHNAAHVSGQFAQLAAGVFKRLCEMIREGQRAGRFDPGYDPQYAAISTIAQVVYFHIARPAVGILLGHGVDGPPANIARAYATHAADFAVAALSTHSTMPSPRRKRP
jgi:AcrR family transcriptional regulator